MAVWKGDEHYRETEEAENKGRKDERKGKINRFSIFFCKLIVIC